MSTPYDNIYTAFTSKIQDKMFDELTETLAEAQMIQLLNDGLIYFTSPKVNVFDKNDTTETFNVTLGYHEIQIISNLMKLAWYDRQIANIELIKQKFSDKDFRLTSQANHLAKLQDVREKHFETCRRLLRNYSKTASDNISVDYSYLAGDEE